MDRRFGRKTALDDALRTLTLTAPNGGPGTGGSGSGAGFFNKIALYRADGSPLVFYDPNEAGLVAALAAAVAGDTVWLPSIPLALTAGITLVEATELISIDENAVLMFDGFSGAAITMADDAVVSGFTLVFVSNGTTAIGVDARFSGAVVDLPVVVVSGGSTDNIGVWAGAPDV